MADLSWMDAIPNAASATPPPSAPPAPSATGAPPNATGISPTKDLAWMDSIPDAAPISTAPAPSANGGIIKNLAAGAIEGGSGVLNALSDPFGNLIGKPLATGLTFAHDALAPVFGYKRFDAHTRNFLTGDSVPQIGTQITEGVGKAMNAPSPSEVPATTPAEQMARAAGAGAVGLPALSPSSGWAAKLLEGAAGAAGGAAGNLVHQSVPEWAGDAADLATNMAVGGGMLGAGAGLAKAADVAKPLAQNFAAPFTEGGRERLAARRIADAASDPAAVQSALTTPQQPLVPGSEPTTFQATADPGLGTLERGVSRDARYAPAFDQRRAEQNAARVGAVQNQVPAADPDAVGQMFRDQLQSLDNTTQAITGQATSRAQQATAALGNPPPSGSDAQATALQGFGQNLRGGLSALNDEAKGRVGSLYDQVDPDGTLAVDTHDIRQAAQTVQKGLPQNAAPLNGDAPAILGVAQMQPAVQSFREIGALRGRVTDAMRAELSTNGRTPTYRALTQVLGSIDDTLTNGVAQRAGADAAAVDAGTMGSDQAIPQRLQQWADNQRAAAEQSAIQAGTRRSNSAGSGDLSGTPENGNAGVSGAEGEAASGPGGASRTAGLQDQAQPPLTPNFDAEAAARYRAANAAHAERVQTFQEAPGVGQVMAPGQRAGEFKLPDSQVAANLFTPGKGAAERIQAFQKASAGRPDLMNTLGDYAAFSLRRAAENADGTLDPAKANFWIKQHNEALSAFPDLKAKFGTAVAARQALDEAVARRVQARQQFDRSIAAKFIDPDADPVEAVGNILRGQNASARMAELARATAGNPEAREAVQGAVFRYMLREMRSNNALGGDLEQRAFKSDQLQTFINRHVSETGGGALRSILSRDQLEALNNVALDLRRANLSNMTKAPGGSDTALNASAQKVHEHRPSTVGLLAAMEAAGELGKHVAGGFARIAGMVGTTVLNSMRQNGFKTVDDLVADAMLHPDRARALFQSLPSPLEAPSRLATLKQQIRALALSSEINTENKEKRK